MRQTADNEAPRPAFRTPSEALEHIVIMLERGERVPYWAVTEARAVIDATRDNPPGE